MGIWAKVKGFFSAPPQPAAPSGPVPELVILLSEPLNPTVEFIHGGVEFALEAQLSLGDAGSTEFVTGEFPIFFAQHQGRLIQIKTMPKPYTSSECRPFVNGDLDRLVRKAGAVRETLQTHQGWISVALMNAGPQVAPGEGYDYVGKILAAFALKDVVALVWPAEAKILPWSDDLILPLMEGQPLELFA